MITTAIIPKKPKRILMILATVSWGLTLPFKPVVAIAPAELSAHKFNCALADCTKEKIGNANIAKKRTTNNDLEIFCIFFIIHYDKEKIC
jgi:hypothetical protein